jgi:pyridoxamine 5'-phosphate oxidase
MPADPANAVPLAAKLFDRLTAGRGLPTPLPADPFPTFQAWFDEAGTAKQQPNPSAFSLATVDPDGRPSNRMVLCRGIDVAAGSIRFFTNYSGRKGRALSHLPFAAACFHWDHLDKQVRLEGRVVRTTDAESDAYFASREWDKKIGAWASAQSEPIASRAELIGKAMEVLKQHGISPAELALKGDAIQIPRPPHWGGLRILVDRLELWLGSSGRFHDRARWTRELPRHDATAVATPWSATRLQP